MGGAALLTSPCTMTKAQNGSLRTGCTEDCLFEGVSGRPVPGCREAKGVSACGGAPGCPASCPGGRISPSSLPQAPQQVWPMGGLGGAGSRRKGEVGISSFLSGPIHWHLTILEKAGAWKQRLLNTQAAGGWGTPHILPGRDASGPSAMRTMRNIHQCLGATDL